MDLSVSHNGKRKTKEEKRVSKREIGKESEESLSNINNKCEWILYNFTWETSFVPALRVFPSSSFFLCSMYEVEKAQAEFVLWLSFRGERMKTISNIHIQTKQKLFFLYPAISHCFSRFSCCRSENYDWSIKFIVCSEIFKAPKPRWKIFL